MIHKDSGHLVKALEAYTRLLEIRPSDLESLNNRGNILRELSLFEKAFQDLNKANEIINNQKITSLHEAEPWVIYLNLGNVLILMGRYTEANNFFDKGLALRPNSFELQKSKGAILFYLTYYQEAITHYHAALKIKPHDIEIQFDIALAHLSIGNYDEGFKCYESRAGVKKLEGIWTGQEGVSENYQESR